MRYKIKDTVYLKTGDDREARLITAIVRRYKSTQYELVSGLNTTWHYDFEFSKEEVKEKNVKVKGLVK